VNATHPLSKLTAAELTLIASIDAATARPEAVGTASLDAALERLRNAAHAATARLQDAGAIVAALAGDVLESVLGEAMGIEASIGIPADAAQVQPAIGYTYTGPTDDPAILHELPSSDVLARLPFLFAGQRPPEPEPVPRRTGFGIVDEFFDIAAEAEAEPASQPQPAEPQTPREKYPAAPAFTPDGPTLFDAAGNADDPTAVLLGDKAVPYVASAPPSRSGTNGDAGAGHAVASPTNKRRGR
jgi:hypothetical protein